MKLIIFTQYKESYGDEMSSYWKNKGGSIYIVENLTTKQIDNIKNNEILTLTSLIEYNNSMSEEFIISSEFVEDSAVVCEEWESPYILSYNDKWIARRSIENDCVFHSLVKTRHEQYDMLPEGGKENYIVTYDMVNGDMGISVDEANERCK